MVKKQPHEKKCHVLWHTVTIRDEFDPQWFSDFQHSVMSCDLLWTTDTKLATLLWRMDILIVPVGQLRWRNLLRAEIMTELNINKQNHAAQENEGFVLWKKAFICWVTVCGEALFHESTAGQRHVQHSKTGSAQYGRSPHDCLSQFELLQRRCLFLLLTETVFVLFVVQKWKSPCCWVKVWPGSCFCMMIVTPELSTLIATEEQVVPLKIHAARLCGNSATLKSRNRENCFSLCSCLTSNAR